MKKIITGVLSMFVISIVLLGCNTLGRRENNQEIIFQEMSRIYVLTDEDEFYFMPTVTLYENGDAELSQPRISSFGLFEKGYYEINNSGELEVSYSENIGATFEISDNGDTLTLKSASLGFTKVGSVYKIIYPQE